MHRALIRRAPEALSRPQDGWPARALYECFTRDIRLPSPRNKYGGPPAFVYKSLRPLRVRDGDRGGRRALWTTNSSRETAFEVRRHDAGSSAYDEFVFSVPIPIHVMVLIIDKTRTNLFGTTNALAFCGHL
ncbi:hypothetical protein EVAR_47023_1 [Eumeta japonica]|uniref:Uncharacterized protein n=1 Tax=Eumeta variegata TaxID=151549 RepID=A0A4C1XFE1_EUMVA|nr:hypothetical protein EVAR_47023_1 [Eumeta japonica]